VVFKNLKSTGARRGSSSPGNSFSPSSSAVSGSVEESIISFNLPESTEATGGNNRELIIRPARLNAGGCLRNHSRAQCFHQYGALPNLRFDRPTDMYFAFLALEGSMLRD
jgi:hypothetical protein